MFIDAAAGFSHSISVRDLHGEQFLDAEEQGARNVSQCRVVVPVRTWHQLRMPMHDEAVLQNDGHHDHGGHIPSVIHRGASLSVVVGEPPMWMLLNRVAVSKLPFFESRVT
jgi:hypothetical protein